MTLDDERIEGREPRASENARRVSQVTLLFSLAWPERRLLALAAVCMGVSALATAGYAYLVGPVLRSLFLGPESLADLEPSVGVLRRLSAELSGAGPRLIGLAIVIAAAVKGAAFFGQTVLAGRAGQEILHSLRARLYRGLLARNPLSPAMPSRGEMVTGFTVDVEKVESAITQGVVATLRDGLQIIALAALALMLDPLLGLVGLVAFPPVGVLVIRIGRRLRKRRAAVHEAFGELGSLVDETTAGLPVIRSFASEEMMEKRFISRSRRIARSTLRAIVLRASSSPLNELLGASALALTLWLAHQRITSGALAPEGFVSFFTALFLLYQPVKSLGQAQYAMQAGAAALDRIHSLFEGETEASWNRREGSLANPLREVRLADAETGYGDGPSVLCRFNLVLKTGSRIAVVGRSGAGKTTLLNLLQGFVGLRSGELLVDGVPVDSALTGRLFAPVSQEPFLFDDTIRMNVRAGRPESTDDEVAEACAAAGVTLFSEDLPLGLDTPVGRGGRALSIGQRQRVCLARALLSRAPILLLDEVTASLDGETEQALVEGLDAFLSARTVLVVTHRLSTARWADEVILLENGAVASRGSLEELLRIDGQFRKLFGPQLAPYGENHKQADQRNESCTSFP